MPSEVDRPERLPMPLWLALFLVIGLLARLGQAQARGHLRLLDTVQAGRPAHLRS